MTALNLLTSQASTPDKSLELKTEQEIDQLNSSVSEYLLKEE
jgi:hypothetical protein